MAADGSAQAHADRMADLLRRGMEAILEEEGAAGYAYGDSSVFHVYMEAYPGQRRPHPRRRSTPPTPTTLKTIPGHVIAAFQRNLNIRGVDLMSYNGGVTSAAHTEEDIQPDARTPSARRSASMLDEQILARVG